MHGTQTLHLHKLTIARGLNNYLFVRKTIKRSTVCVMQLPFEFLFVHTACLPYLTVHANLNLITVSLCAHRMLPYHCAC